jgi:hypothetical protein
MMNDFTIAVSVPVMFVSPFTSSLYAGVVVPIPTLPDPLTNSNEVLPDDTCKGTCTPEPEMLTDPDTCLILHLG